MAYGLEGFNLQITPDLQRRIQRVRASGLQPGASRFAEEQEYQQHAGKEMNKYLSSREQARQYKGALSGLKLSKKRLALEKERGLSSHMYRMGLLEMEQKALANQREQAMWHGLFGLGGMGLGMYQDKQARGRDLDYRKALGEERYGIYDYLRKMELGVPHRYELRYGGR
jgi:hypothetical protein